MRASKLAILVLCVLPWSDGALAQSIPGDANGDGRIDAADVLLIVERILERGVLPGDGDCNRDTVINVLDTICAQQSFVPGETDPIILGPGDRSIPVDLAFQMNLFAADPDTGSRLSWELLSGPAGLSVDTAGVLSWTPAVANLGNNPVSVRVTDNTARTADASFVIAVFELPPASPANAAPTLMVPTNQSILVGVPLALQATAMDADVGDTLTYRLVDAPADMSIDPATGAISWPAQGNPLATADVVVSVADAAGETAFGRFTVRADAANGAPTARDDVYVARKGETLTVAASEGVIQNDRDPNGDTLNASSLSDPMLGTLDSFNTDGGFSYTTTAPTPITIGLVEKCTTTALTLAGTTSIADMDGDGDVEMAGIAINGNFARVFIADPSDCSHEFFPLAAGLGQPNFFALTTLVNLDDDPELELVAPYSRFSDFVPDSSIPGADERLMAVNIDGTPVAAWGPGGLSEALDFEGRFAPFQQLAGPVAADLDGDGDPELIMGFNNAEPLGTGSTSSNAVIAYDGRTGTILWEFRGGITRPENRGISPVLVDLDLDGDTEIIWNQFVLDHTGALLFELPAEQTIFGGGNTFLTTAIANFDNDAFPEILAYDRSNLYLFTHSGAIVWQRPFISNGSFSDLTIAELDGDPFPEFVAMLGTTVPTGNVDLTPATLYAFDSDGEDLWDNIADEFLVRTLTATRTSTPVAFDLDQDGIDELIQVRTETAATASGLYILNGETGETIDFQVSPTTNSYDQAVTVADVDGDGSAEIITSPAINFGLQPLQVWDNLPGNPFPPARSIRTQHNVQPTWVNAEGTPLSEIKPHWLQPGRNGWNMIQPDVDPLAPEQDSFTYRVSDGEFDSNTATVNIEVRPAGNPPFFISEPDTATSRGARYEYRVLTVDVDPGDVVSYALVNGPPGMSIDAETGVLSWFADANGEYPVSIIASDTVGRNTAQIYRLTVGDPVVVPDVVGSGEAAAGTTLRDVNLLTGDVFRRIHPTQPAGTVYEQNPIAGSAAAFGAAVDLFVSSGPGPLNTDDDSDGYTENQGDCNDNDNAIFPGAADGNGDGIDQDCDGIDGNKVLVAIELTPNSKRVLTNSPVPLTATGVFDDGTAQNLTALATWTRGPTFFEASSGNFTAQASFSGVTGSAVINVVDRVVEDLAPVARIDSPSSGGGISAPTDIIGTATDTNLLRWELSYQQDGEGEFILFAENTTRPVDDVIAAFDPTTLLNGVYNIRLRVFDRGGNVSQDTTTVIVDSQLKVGNFRLSYIDLELPLNGIPLTLTRNYDSRDKRVGDFGVGWRLGVDSIEIRTNRELGTGWQVFRQGLVFGLVATDAHIAAIRMPGGRIETFEMVVGPAVSPIIPFPPLSQSVSFRPLPQTLGTLESLQENEVSILDAQPGLVSLRLNSNGNIYDPTLFRYTSPDGTKFDLDSNAGIQRIEMPTGQVLSFTPQSITHSNGTSVIIERDSIGRISSFTDPTGFSQSYIYDANGDLRAHSDQQNLTTRFEYDANHNVIGVIDPLGRPLARNEFDSDGRLIRTTNTDGRIVEFSHDLAARQEVVTDVDGAITVLDYDDRGNVLRVTDALGNITVNTYDANDNQLSTTNALNETITRTFDSRNNTLTETDPLGNTIRFDYDELSKVASVTDALGRTATYSYDTKGSLLGETDTLGNTTSYIYDANGNLLIRRNAAGHIEEFVYDDHGNQTSRIDGKGKAETFSYDANGHPVSETSRRGVSVSTTLDARGLPVGGQDAAGRALTFQWNSARVMTTVTDPDGNTTVMQTDADDKELSFRDALGNETRKGYDLKGNLVTLRDPAGRVTIFSYDALNRVIRTTFPDGATIGTGYDAVGRVVEEEDGRGNVTRYEYDAAGRNTTVIDALGNTTTYAYDAAGNRIRMIDANGGVFEYGYDAMNQPTRTTYPDGSFTEIAYDVVGQLVSETDALGRMTTYEYDQNGNLTDVVDAMGGHSRYVYDAGDNLVIQTDALDRNTTFNYDDFGRRVSTTYPDGSTTSLTYDLAGNIATQTDQNGSTTVLDYDAGGRLIRKTFADSSEESFAYSVTGQIVMATNTEGSVSYEYDANDRLIGVENSDGSRINYRYDAAGNRIENSIRLSAGSALLVTGYSYDALNRVQTVTSAEGGVTQYSYDDVGNLTSTSYPNGVTSNYEYDANNRLTELSHRNTGALLAGYVYEVNPVGDRTRVTSSLDGSYIEYAYDGLRRLSRESHYNSAASRVFELRYEYDAVGNRTALVDLSGSNTMYSYDTADKLLMAGSTRFLYDANGNQLSKRSPAGESRYSFDTENQLVGVTTQGQDVNYAYDAIGERIERSGNDTTRYLVDPVSTTGFSQVLAEYDGAGSTAEYVYADKLVSRHADSETEYYHADSNNNVRLLTDASGEATDRYAYSGFGGLIEVSGSSENLYGFAGERYDPTTALTYLRARYYDPQTGRFISRDPFEGRLKDPVSLHRYLYANVNPIVNRDPSGQFTLTSVQISTAISVTIGGISSGAAAYAGGKRGYQLVAETIIGSAFGAIGGVYGTALATAFAESKVIFALLRNPVVAKYASRLVYAIPITALNLTEDLSKGFSSGDWRKDGFFGELLLGTGANLLFNTLVGPGLIDAQEIKTVFRGAPTAIKDGEAMFTIVKEASENARKTRLAGTITQFSLVVGDGIGTGLGVLYEFIFQLTKIMVSVAPSYAE